MCLSEMDVNIVSTLRKPENTGDNRCMPCTVLNVAIATIVGVALSRKSRILSAIAVALSIGLIYLRGYLVPGTPTLTKRYLPPEVLRWFGKEPEEPPVMSGLGATTDQTENSSTKEIQLEKFHSTSQADNSDGTTDTDSQEIEPEKYFLELEILESCEGEDDLCLTESFSTAWSEPINKFDDKDISADQTAEAFGFEIIDYEYQTETHGNARVLYRGSKVIGKWPSRAALVTDLGAAAVIETMDSDWNEFDPQEKGQLLNSLRLFFEDLCPGDSGAVKFNEETVESCCQSHDVLAVTCANSGERLFEFPLDRPRGVV